MAKPESEESIEQPLLTHLVELRDRLVKIIIVVAVIFACLVPFANEVYLFVAEPLHRILPKDQNMIATGVISPFLTPFKLCLMVAFYIAIPFVLYQVWGFVAPGLYKHEKKLVMPLAVSSTILFYAGMLFAYYVVFPLVFPFLAGTTPDGIAYTPDIKDYLNFALKLFFAFGVAFEVPIATILFVKTGMTTTESLANKRPYIIIGAFVLGMLLTPPDIISQTLLAIPMWLLFELGLIFARRMNKKTSDASEDDFSEMTEEEMEAELNKIEAEEEQANV